MSEEKTVFEKIVAGEIPCEKVYEDNSCLAFHDLNPQAPVHVLVIPKKKLVNVMSATDADTELLGLVLQGARKAAAKLGLNENGYRLVLNNGRDGGESVHYLHCHILGGRPLSWPPG